MTLRALNGSGMQSSAGVPLFAGGTVPIYHPSLVPRGRAGSPHAPDMGLHPTSPEALDDLLKQLKTDKHTLEVSSDSGSDNACYHADPDILMPCCTCSAFRCNVCIDKQGL